MKKLSLFMIILCLVMTMVIGLTVTASAEATLQYEGQLHIGPVHLTDPHGSIDKVELHYANCDCATSTVLSNNGTVSNIVLVPPVLSTYLDGDTYYVVAANSGHSEECPYSTSLELNDNIIDKVYVYTSPNVGHTLSAVTFEYPDVLNGDSGSSVTVDVADLVQVDGLSENDFCFETTNIPSPSGTQVGIPVNGIYVKIYWEEDTTTFTVEGVASPEDGGTVTGSGAVVAGGSVTLTAVANAGYDFVGWYDESGNKVWNFAEYTVQNVAADVTYTAKFEKAMYMVTATIEPETAGGITYVPNSGVVYYGESVTLTATANVGYVFDGWYLDGEFVSAELQYVVENVTGNMAFTAKFNHTEEGDNNFDTFFDAGYYGETRNDQEYGIISFNTHYIGSLDYSNIESFGMWIFKGTGETGTQSFSVAEFEANDGKFFATIDQITPDQFDTVIYAKPFYVDSDGKVHFGATLKATVNTVGKWLGQNYR